MRKLDDIPLDFGKCRSSSPDDDLVSIQQLKSSDPDFR